MSGYYTARLKSKQAALRQELEKVEKALAALEANPESEAVAELLDSAGANNTRQGDELKLYGLPSGTLNKVSA